MNYKKILIIIIILMFTLTGCSNSKQIHERLIIQGIAIDKIKDEYNLTVQIFDTKGGPDTGESNNITKIMSSNGKSIADAFEKISTQSGREPLYSQNLMIVIGEDTAKLGMRNILDFFIRSYETRPSVNLFISQGSASEILTTQNDNELIPAKDISILSKNEELSAKTPNSNLLQFISSIESGITDPSASLLLKQNGKITTSGTALFNGEKFSGYLNENESKGSLLLNKKVKSLEDTIFVDKIGNISFDIMNSKRKIDVKIENDIPKFYIDIFIKTRITEIDRSFIKRLSSENFDNINSEIEKHIEKLVEASIQKSINDCNSDIFNFSKILRNKQTNYFKTTENHLKSILKNSIYDIEVNSKIKKIGQEMNLW